MSNSDYSSEQRSAPSHTQLHDAAVDFQRTDRVLRYWLKNKPASTFIPILQVRQRSNTQQLWDFLEGPFMELASGWDTRSGMANAMREHPSYKTRHDIRAALARTAFAATLDALSRLKIDRNKNLLGCLVTIGWRMLKHDHDKIYSISHYREGKLLSENTNSEYTNDAADREYDLVEQVLSPIVDPIYLAEIQHFWEQNLTLENKRIMHMLLRETEKPTSEEIAREMGPGWNGALIRQRIHRIIQMTRNHLHKIGCAEFTNLDTTKKQKQAITLNTSTESNNNQLDNGSIALNNTVDPKISQNPTGDSEQLKGKKA